MRAVEKAVQMTWGSMAGRGRLPIRRVRMEGRSASAGRLQWPQAACLGPWVQVVVEPRAPRRARQRPLAAGSHHKTKNVGMRFIPEYIGTQG